ncbi:ABC transporter-like protein [Gracilibacillus halophilus YIM-C55.5]|uniref:ABC transporter-like protein n=1 Tax=Gracilibacillus halophilus YIM-C55.5 TaxID=1308866 RepID=N4WP92_9BACI|nr:ATP-binding cassette domain-containing protein [Gracilibacillus halophilus]ENH97942.1 ABC transporter-like protein [Gracilibacillus halophilus YIM-C55.5]
MFELKQVTYQDILQIDQLVIPSQKITCLFGESGSGKSTLLRLLNHMITPDEGDVLYQGDDIEKIDPVQLRRNVVMLGQDPVMFEGTVKDNLLIGVRLAEKDEPRSSTLKSMLTDLQLHKSLDDDASKLSGGEKQRVALGRVLLMDAKVYLFDEPTSALDDDTEDVVMDYVTEYIQQKRQTAVMVTHSKEIADRYADQMIYMTEIQSQRGEPHGSNA